MPFKRTITPFLRSDLEKKIVLLSGPRQVGKTTLSRNLSARFEYLNFDSEEDRAQILKKEWDRKTDLLVLDEIHKMPKWKAWLKGVYDKEGIHPPILVTGSSRMDVMKKMGDSLAGRHFQYRLYPLDLKEAKGKFPPEEIYRRLLTVSGFPEPFLEGTDSFHHKWKKSHLDLILRQDLLDLESVREIVSVESLVSLLQSRAAAPLSYASVGRDLQKDTKTIQRWVQILENLFVVFRVLPYHRNIARSLLKEPKLYFYDTSRLEGDEGRKLENLVALSLKKEVDYLSDALGIEASLHSLRIRGGDEIDFLVLRKNKLPLLLEVKLSDAEPSRQFSQFGKYFPRAHKVQIVKNLSREKMTEDGVEIREALQWLTNLDLEKLP